MSNGGENEKTKGQKASGPPITAIWTGREECRFCRFARSIGDGRLECRAGPPSVASVPIWPQIQSIAGLSPGELARLMNWIVQAFWPPVRPEGYCGKFYPRPEIVN